MEENNNFNGDKKYFEKFITLQNQIVKDEDNKNIPSLNLDELFKYLEQHFSEFHESTNLNAILPLIHRCLVEWTQNGAYLNGEKNCEKNIGTLLLNFLDQHLEDENDLAVVVQITFQILNSLNILKTNHDIKVEKQVFINLSKRLPNISNRILISSVIDCLRQYIHIFPENRQEIIKGLWSDLSKYFEIYFKSLSPALITIHTEIEILMQLFEEFHEVDATIDENPIIVSIIQQLLQADQREYRKYGYYFFKQMLQHLVVKFEKFGSVWITTHSSQTFEQLWISYITILENLEERQTNSILTSLKNLSLLIESKQLQISWLEILYMKILTYNDIAVLYWAMEFILKTFTISDLSKNVIRQLLETSNNTLLYNYEGYFLKPQLFERFLNYDLAQLYELMTQDIEWKAIPLMVWIKAVNANKNEQTPISYEQLLKLAAKVFKVDNPIIRQEVIKIMNQIFDHIIDKMSMKEYVQYVETLYNTTDLYEDFPRLYNKKASLMEMVKEEGEQVFTFKKTIFEIYVKNIGNYDVDEFITFLNDIPQKHQGWLKFIPYHYYDVMEEHNLEILNKFHGMDLKSLASFKLTDIIAKFEQDFNKDNLVSESEKQEFKIQSHMAAISIYIQQKETLDQEDDETFKIIFNSELSKCNFMKTFTNLWLKLCNCLKKTKKIFDNWIIEEFFNRIDTKITQNVSKNILDYINQVYDNNAKNQHFQNILEKYPQHVSTIIHLYTNPLKLTNQDNFIYGDLPQKGELRIEQLFCLNQFPDSLDVDTPFSNYIWMNGLHYYCDKDYVLYLLDCHKKLTEKKPIYDCYSDEHHVKLRIAVGISISQRNNIHETKIFDDIWTILLNEMNQLNICYIYEFLLGTYDARLDNILEKISKAHDLASSQQVSIIIVTYIFCMKNDLKSEANKEEIISHLLALTMCAYGETRLYAQMVLYKLLNFEPFQGIIRGQQILQSIESINDLKLYENLNDVRLHMHEFQPVTINYILFVTKAKYDPAFLAEVAYFCSPEIFFDANNTSPEIQVQLMKCRNLYLKKLNNVSTARVSNKKRPLQGESTDVIPFKKIKLQPTATIKVLNNLITYPKDENNQSDIIIVASFIQELVTLQALARTCIALGIKNLIVDYAMQQNILKVLDLPAGNPLNISGLKTEDLKRFLLNKQHLQGFKIVGLENTSHSVELNGFIVPPKCILLLGHELHGIPAILLGLLDDAVKISQNHKMYSLNVQETAAFYMWKYSEQYLKK